MYIYIYIYIYIYTYKMKLKKLLKRQQNIVILKKCFLVKVIYTQKNKQLRRKYVFLLVFI